MFEHGANKPCGSGTDPMQRLHSLLCSPGSYRPRHSASLAAGQERRAAFHRWRLPSMYVCMYIHVYLRLWYVRGWQGMLELIHYPGSDLPDPWHRQEGIDRPNNPGIRVPNQTLLGGIDTPLSYNAQVEERTKRETPAAAIRERMAVSIRRAAVKQPVEGLPGSCGRIVRLRTDSRGHYGEPDGHVRMLSYIWNNNSC